MIENNLMKKLLLILIIFPLYSNAELQFIKKTSYGDVYWNSANIQKNRNDEYFIEIVDDYGVRQKGIDRVIGGKLVYDTHFQPLSAKSAHLIHCKQAKTALLGQIYFSDKMAKGKKIFNEVESNPSWTQDIYTDIGNIYPTIRKLACNKLIK